MYFHFPVNFILSFSFVSLNNTINKLMSASLLCSCVWCKEPSKMTPLAQTSSSSSSSHYPPLNTLHVHRRAVPNRIFAIIYVFAILLLLYHHTFLLLSSSAYVSFFLRLTLLFSDALLAFMWATTTSFRVRPVQRREFPDNLARMINDDEGGDYPRLDAFICTADPYKEPPMSAVNTALSVMAYEYPMDKISVYVSDDGGSRLTFFAFMEAARFARHWLPFCKEKRLVERCPEAYFSNNHCCSDEAHEEMKTMYEIMKRRVEIVVERGYIDQEYFPDQHEHEAFNKWKPGFTRQDHPTVIEVLLESGRDKDIAGQKMPNFIYISREKSKNSPHNFKAGALNVLLRVSATMTNAPIILTLDCDMYSNDPQTPLRALCYLWEPIKGSERAYVQFPQHFHGINKNDIYGCEIRGLFTINPIGMNGLQGTSYVGTGCFFRRRALFGCPSSNFYAEALTELNIEHFADAGVEIQSEAVLSKAHHVASRNYEHGTKWGSKIGFRYGSLVEDYFTGYLLHCEGWKTVFCNPDRPAFLGDIPITLNDALNQNKRWAIGMLEVAFSKYNPVTFGIKSMGLLMGLAYSHYAFWPIWSIPITTYAFLPPLALFNGSSIFPKVSEPWFYLYVFLFLGAYVQDFLGFILTGGTIRRWWSDQRMWLIRGVASYLFGSIDYLLKSFGISPLGFNLTSKVIDDEQSKRYKQGVFEFGIDLSPFFISLTTVAIINLIGCFVGVLGVFKHENFEEMFIQLFISGFVVVNCLPIYEAIALRTDGGRMPTKTTIISLFLVGILCCVTKARN